jgi:hypothetical protein
VGRDVPLPFIITDMTDVISDVLFFEILDNGPAGVCRAVFLSATQHI